MGEAQMLEVDGRRVKISNLDKVLYPATGFIEGDVIRYYCAVAPMIVPHIAQHPLTLKRYPDGGDAPHFYEKRCPAYRPDRIPLLEMPSKRHGVVHYCSIEDTAGLMWLANLASLEIHPYLARAPHLDRPTAIVFDLAPGQELVYPRGRVALLLRDALAEVGMTTLVKSTGSKGLHVTMPIDGTEDYRHQGVRPRARSPAGTALAPTWSSPRCTESPVRAR
jgi:bifunctional non-homologous end joining protein LigD